MRLMMYVILIEVKFGMLPILVEGMRCEWFGSAWEPQVKIN